MKGGGAEREGGRKKKGRERGAGGRRGTERERGKKREVCVWVGVGWGGGASFQGMYLCGVYLDYTRKPGDSCGR